MSDDIYKKHIADSEAFGLVPENLSRPCGWCGQPAWFRRRQAVQAGWWFAYDRDYRPQIAAVYECSGCNHASMGIFQAYTVGGSWHASLLEVLPMARAAPLGLEQEEVEADRLEAWACHYAGQHRAAVLMARSALQRAVRVLDQNFRKSLNDELDNLVTSGIITQQLRRNADEVRLLGNDVAHPEELGAVSETDAEDSLSFLDDFLETTLVIPQRQRRRQQAREER